MLHPNDAVWVLDVCDRALGEGSQRGHRFAWLLSSSEPGAEPARVDAWYPPLGLALDLRVHDDDEHHRRARIVRAYGLEYVVLDVHRLERDPQGRLRRLDGDEERIGEQLAAEARAEQTFEWGGPMSFTYGGEQVAGFTVYAGGPIDEDWDGDEDEHEYNAEPWQEPDIGTPVDEVGPVDSATAEVLGWRGRSMAQALVGALALSRRALGVDVVGEGVRADGLDVLLALAAAEVREAVEPGLTHDEIATALGSEAWLVERALERQEADGTVRSVERGDQDDLIWVLEPPGLGFVLEWLGRASPLFGDWPRD